MIDLRCGKAEDVLPTLADGSIDAVVTDPPYNVGLEYSGLIDDSRGDYAEWCRTWFAELRRVCSGPISISIGQSNLSLWARIAPPDWWLAWWKPAAMGRCPVGFNNWEPIALYGRPVKAVCDVIRATIRPDKSLEGHPCPKPLEWAVKQIEMLTLPGQTVLDPFIGSGTVALACYQLGRCCVGIEQSPDYIAIAQRRLDAARSATPLLTGCNP